MITGPDGVAVMHYFERCQLRAYPDPGSPLFAALMRAGIYPYGLTSVPPDLAHLSGRPWTIGLGDTGPDVVPGLEITQDQADERFARRLRREFEPGVMDCVQQEMTQRQFDALVCLAYNIGLPNFRSSTLLRRFNLGDIAAASAQFLVWNKSGGKVMLGLKRRRAAERALFDGKSGSEAIAIGAAVSS